MTPAESEPTKEIARAARRIPPRQSKEFLAGLASEMLNCANRIKGIAGLICGSRRGTAGAGPDAGRRSAGACRAAPERRPAG